MIITIDGAAGTGKTTIAKTLAQRLGYRYFETGAMYRALTYLMLKDPKKNLMDILNNFHFSIEGSQEDKKYFVNHEDLTPYLRSEEVTRAVSQVAAQPQVRHFLVSIQRAFGQHKEVIFEGRDMGTVVFPKADLKIFLVASLEVRALRRYEQMYHTVPTLESLHKIQEQIQQRDFYDETRELSPLKQAVDAHLIDTSHLTIEESVDRIIALIPS